MRFLHKGASTIWESTGGRGGSPPDSPQVCPIAKNWDAPLAQIQKKEQGVYHITHGNALLEVSTALARPTGYHYPPGGR